MTITKRDLVLRIAEKTGSSREDVAIVVEHVLSDVSKALAAGNRWELRDFGIFEVKQRAPRVGRNPRSGVEVAVPTRKVVKFHQGKKMKEWVQNGIPEEYKAAAKSGGLGFKAIRPSEDAADSGSND